MNMINITLDRFMKIINSTNFRTKNFLLDYLNFFIKVKYKSFNCIYNNAIIDHRSEKSNSDYNFDINNNNSNNSKSKFLF